MSSLREVLLRVVDDAVCAERSRLLDVPRRADGRDVRAERLGDLHRVRADASRRAVDQHLLPGLQLAVVAERLERCDRRDRNGGRLLERHVGRLRHEPHLPGRCVLGPRARPRAEHLVARLELRDVAADRFDATGEIGAHARVLGPAQPASPNTLTNDGPVDVVPVRRVEDDACTRTSTWWSSIGGVSTSLSSRTSGGP